MTKEKKFNTGATAELFITGAKPADQPQLEAAQPETLDIHESQRQTAEYIQELKTKAIELEQQAKGITLEAAKAKRNAIAAANAKYRGRPTTKYRQPPDYANPRSRRVQIMLRPDVFNRAKEYCEANGLSFNAFIEIATLAILDGKGGKR